MTQEKSEVITTLSMVVNKTLLGHNHLVILNRLMVSKTAEVYLANLELKARLFCVDICRLYSSARCSTSLLVLPSGEGQEHLGLHQHLGNKVS